MTWVAKSITCFWVIDQLAVYLANSPNPTPLLSCSLTPCIAAYVQSLISHSAHNRPREHVCSKSHRHARRRNIAIAIEDPHRHYLSVAIQHRCDNHVVVIIVTMYVATTSLLLLMLRACLRGLLWAFYMLKQGAEQSQKQHWVIDCEFGS